MNAQAFADTEGARAEFSYELYRAWAAEHELQATEQRLRQGGGESEDESRGLHRPVVLRLGWAWFVGAFAVGALIGVAGWR